MNEMSFFCWKQVTIISITLKLTLFLFYVLCVTQFWALITAVVRPVMSSSLTTKKTQTRNEPSRTEPQPAMALWLNASQSEIENPHITS